MLSMCAALCLLPASPLEIGDTITKPVRGIIAYLSIRRGMSCEELEDVIGIGIPGYYIPTTANGFGGPVQTAKGSFVDRQFRSANYHYELFDLNVVSWDGKVDSARIMKAGSRPIGPGTFAEWVWFSSRGTVWFKLPADGPPDHAGLPPDYPVRIPDDK